MKQEEPNCVYKVNGDIEAQQIKAFLAAHGINCEFRGEALRMTHGLTLDDIQTAAKKYLSTPNIATFILLPENRKDR